MRKLIAFFLATIMAVTGLSMLVFAADDTVHLTYTDQIYIKSGDQLIDSYSNVTGETKPNKVVFIQLDVAYTWDVAEQTALGVAPYVPTLGVANVGAVTTKLGELFADSDYFKLTAKKGDDNKSMIKKMSVVETKLDNSNSRHSYIKIELFDDYTDKEYKITPYFTFTAKKDFYITQAGDVSDEKPAAALQPAFVPKGTKYVIESAALKNGPGPQSQGQAGAIYISNELIKNEADRDWAAGTGGYVVKPVKNEDNSVTWEDEIRTIAWLDFSANSDSNVYFPKLSTKWDNADYAELFVDQDAFIYSFVGTPKISSTSRATLSLYNPYFDEDYQEKTGTTVTEEDIVIYEVNADGELIDVTKEFTFEENEDGVAVFTTKTRVLGTYIAVEKTLWEAKQEEPETPPETGGGEYKGVPNTGC